MALGHKIKLDAGLYMKAKARAAELSYASVDEFVSHVLERELSRSTAEEVKAQQVNERLKGLGYM